ncbi:MAG: tRNA (guanosine(46)-N(7))-methyltransferase TrmB [Kofleriaceae bacterium]
MRIRQHVNPNQAHFARFRGAKPVLDDRPIEVEIGCADAQFLFERAAQDPERQYIGLEIREDLVHLVNKRARRTGAPVHAVFCQAQLHMAEIFPPGSLARVYINFPDPWFKRRHHDRRMIDAALADGIAAAAGEGAEILVQTDVWELALASLATFEPDDRFDNLAGEWTFWRGGNPYGVRSWREQNAEETGLPIWRLLYRRTGQRADP